VKTLLSSSSSSNDVQVLLNGDGRDVELLRTQLRAETLASSSSFVAMSLRFCPPDGAQLWAEDDNPFFGLRGGDSERPTELLRLAEQRFCAYKLGTRRGCGGAAPSVLLSLLSVMLLSVESVPVDVSMAAAASSPFVRFFFLAGVEGATREERLGRL